LFGVKKYADALWSVCKKRDIEVKLKHNLVEVLPGTSEAIFEDLEHPGKTIAQKVLLFKFSCLKCC
jgi:sulfide:quinone oxidoreductase